MRLTSIALALAVVLGIAWWFVLREPATEAVAADADAPPVAAGAVDEAVPVMVLASEAQDVTERTVLRGRTEANRVVEMRAETSGLVMSEPLRAGALVEAGEVVCRIDPGGREAQLAEAEAALAEARAEASAAETLSAKGFTAETTRIAREAALQAAAAQLDLVRLDIGRLEMRAPFSGVLETDAAEIGTLLNVGDLCATLIDLGRVKVTAYISEQEVDRIAEGQAVSVRLINGSERTGRIRFIGRMAEATTRTFRVEAVLDNPKGDVRDGMTAEVMVELPAGRAHRLPQSALTLDDRGRLGVRVAEDGVARFMPVRPLRDEPGGVWVAGLPERVNVIVVGQEFVREGRPVRAVPVAEGDLG